MKNNYFSLHDIETQVYKSISLVYKSKLADGDQHH